MRRLRHHGHPRQPPSFNTLLEMPQPPAVRISNGVGKLLSILYWRCPKAVFAFALALVLPFNTLLEMRSCRGLTAYAMRIVSFNTLLEMLLNALGPATNATVVANFQYSIGDAEEACVRVRHVGRRIDFQYSIGDAEGSCVWFLWVFKFLCRRVWVSCGGLLTVVVLVLSLCWCAEKRGVGVCVFFSSASACAGRLHGVL